MSPEWTVLAHGCQLPKEFNIPGCHDSNRPFDRKSAPGGWHQLGHNFGHRFPGAGGTFLSLRSREQVRPKSINKCMFKIQQANQIKLLSDTIYYNVLVK